MTNRWTQRISDGDPRIGMWVASGSPVCAPSRCVLMTGLHTGHAFIRTNLATNPEGQYPIPEGTVTLARLLNALGYATGAFGKWGLGGPDSTGVPSRICDTRQPPSRITAIANDRILD